MAAFARRWAHDFAGFSLEKDRTSTKKFKQVIYLQVPDLCFFSFTWQVIYAAKRAGATKILKAGGAQAIVGRPSIVP